MSSDLFLTKTPLFTLTPSTLGPSFLNKIFENWPQEGLCVIEEAQQARDNLLNHMKGKFTNMIRIGDIDKYLPLMLGIEKEKVSNPRIGSSKSNKFNWIQSPIVVKKYMDRAFPATYCGNENLHLLFLRAVLLLNQGFEDYESDRLESSVQNLRQSAGMFQYLASDKCRDIDRASAPIEFQSPIFNSLMSLALGQAYAIIASKGERDGMSKSALAKICYTASTTFQTSYEALQSATPQDAIHQQYGFWIQQMIALYHSYACVLYAFAQHQKEEEGLAIGLLRLAQNELNKVKDLYPNNARPNAAIGDLLTKIEPIDKKWSESNFLIACKPIADENASNRFIATSALSILNLPQPIPYSPPEPVALPTGSGSDAGPARVVKRIPPQSAPNL